MYSKAQIVKWSNATEFENLFNRMDGFHQALKYMGDIGKIMKGSGFEDCLIEVKAVTFFSTHKIDQQMVKILKHNNSDYKIKFDKSK